MTCNTTEAARARKRRYYDRNKAEVKARAAAWNKVHPEVMRKVEANYRKRFPNKQVAHAKVAVAIQTGRLTRKPCEVCGAKSVEAHHDDYSKPLNVRWLCKTHHMEVTWI
jgi:ribosomal protein S27AE